MSKLTDIITRARGAMAADVIMRRSPGASAARALSELLDLERQGYATRAAVDAAYKQVLAALAEEQAAAPGRALSRPRIETARALGRADHHLASAQKRRRTTKIGALDMAHFTVGSDSHTDLPPELGAYSDGITDDAAYHPEIIGCGLDALDVSGIPGYLFTAKNLSNAAARRRLGDAIRRLAPKTRRRVLARLRQAVSVARVAGSIRTVTPTISGSGWSAVSGVSGSSAPYIAVGRCPYANVAGALTP